MLEYKGYVGHVEFDDEAKVFHGSVIDIRDVITFQATSVSGLEREFKKSVKVYLEMCKKHNEQPEKPFSGKFNLRLPVELHREVSIAAKKSGESLNNFIAKTLKKAVKV